MRKPIGHVFSTAPFWILCLALAIATGLACYAGWHARQLQVRAEALERECHAREEALAHIVARTLPALAEGLRTADAPTQADMPTNISNSRFAHLLWQIPERYAGDLSQVRTDTAARVRTETARQTQAAVDEAERKARGQVEDAARQATSAAVRAFGTTVVSLGADVSQVLSTALRTHRGDEVYETLTRIDHSVQQMIRQAQAYVIVCGGLPGRRWPRQRVTDVVGGAVGRVRDYTRVRTLELDRLVISRAVEPLVHTLATLLDNALRYSPPSSYVDVGFQEGHHGVTVIIDDAGVRMNTEQMEQARLVLSGERTVDVHELGPSPRVGLPGVAALARRYGFAVYIDGPNAYGGMRAMVFIPDSLLVPRPDDADANSAQDSLTAVETVLDSGAAKNDESPSELDEFAELDELAPAGADTTSGGLPKRRRRDALATVEHNEEQDSVPARPEVAAAWHNGSRSGRTAVEPESEGMTS
ncbi:MAG: sensor histidine kinase [Mycobacteriaceae bacterium]|nr:sensor histidine kinase [Mycobacteriaceae bacterium]